MKRIDDFSSRRIFSISLKHLCCQATEQPYSNGGTNSLLREAGLAQWLARQSQHRWRLSRRGFNSHTGRTIDNSLLRKNEICSAPKAWRTKCILEWSCGHCMRHLRITYAPSNRYMYTGIFAGPSTFSASATYPGKKN